MISTKGIPFHQDDELQRELATKGLHLLDPFTHKFIISDCDRPIIIVAPDYCTASELMHDILDDCSAMEMSYATYYEMRLYADMAQH